MNQEQKIHLLNKAEQISKLFNEIQDLLSDETDSAMANGLEALDAVARERIASIPAGRRVLVTAHDAFRYFGRAYGIEVVGVRTVREALQALR